MALTGPGLFARCPTGVQQLHFRFFEIDEVDTVIAEDQMDDGSTIRQHLKTQTR